MKVDLVIEGATIVDGYWPTPYVGSVAISGDTIVHVSACKSIADAHHIIDGTGMILIPGVIDVHSHSDLAHLQKSPFSYKIKMGVTTEVVGNCGIGSFPATRDDLLGALNCDVLGSADQYNSLNEYKSAFENSPSSNNIVMMQAHAPLRLEVMKENAHRKASSDEIAHMVSLLEHSYQMGAAGFSTGLYYDPCLYASKEELLALLEVTARYDKIFAVHHRTEGDGVLSSLQEVIDLAKESHVTLQVSHLKAIGERNQKFVPRMLDMISEAANDGLNIHFDQYPYEWGATSLSSLLPPSILALSETKKGEILADPLKQKDVIWEIEHPNNYDSIISLCSFNDITLLSYDANRSLESKTIAEIASMWKMDEYNAFFTLIRESHGSALMSDITQSTQSLEMIMSHPLGMFSTDSIYSGTHFHRRSISAVTDLFDRFYRQKETLSLSEHIKRMSVLPAQVFKLSDRGVIQQGYKADLVLLNFPENSSEKSSVESVIINGDIAYENGSMREGYASLFLGAESL
jgi:N-acyl-D-aspartate/D-glutamate deacylase